MYVCMFVNEQALSLVGMVSITAIIYKTKKMLAQEGPEHAINFINTSAWVRLYARFATYLSLAAYIASFAICVVSTASDIFVSIVTGTHTYIHT